MWNNMQVKVFILILVPLFIISCKGKNRIIVSELNVSSNLYDSLTDDIRKYKEELLDNDTCFLSIIEKNEKFHLYFTFENTIITLNDHFFGYFFCERKIIFYLKDENNTKILSDLFKINHDKKLSLLVSSKKNIENKQTQEDDIFYYDPIWFEYEYKSGKLNR